MGRHRTVATARVIGARIKELRLEGSPPGEGGGEMVI